MFESWVLAVDASDDSARLELDLVVLPGHPEYSAPPRGELHRYLGGSVHFSDADAVVLERSDLRPAISSDGTLDLGHIDDWHVDDGCHRLSGDWGLLEVWGGDVELKVDFPANYRVDHLPGLPGTGSAAVNVATSGESGMREGSVLRIHDGRGGAVVVNLQRGWTSQRDQVLRSPHRDRFVLLSGGRGWYVDATRPKDSMLLDGWVHGGASLIRQGLLLVVGEMYISAIDEGGLRWSNQDLGPTYGPVSVVCSDDDTVTAELMDAVTDLPYLVRLRLTDGSRVTA